MALRTLVIILAFTAAASAQDAPAEGERASVLLPTQMCRGYFFMPVTLSPREGYPEDRTLWFLYDTGASTTYVDPDSLERVTGRPFTASRVNLVEATSGPLNINRLPARVGDLTHLSKALGREIDGILAYDAFGDFLVTLDYVAGEIRLDEGRLPEPDEITVFDVDGPDKRPWLDIDFGSRERRMLIDSGAALSGLVVRDLDRYETLAEPRPIGASMRLRAVERNSGARFADDALMGPHTLIAPTLQSTPDTELIGGEVMRHFTWTFDIRRERARIVRNAPDTPIEFGPMRGHGLVLAPDPGGLRVHDVLDGTPAALAGVQRGDIVTHFNGEPLLDRDCAAGDRVEITMTLQRGGETIEIVLDLFPLVD